VSDLLDFKELKEHYQVALKRTPNYVLKWGRSALKSSPILQSGHAGCWKRFYL